MRMRKEYDGRLGEQDPSSLDFDVFENRSQFVTGWMLDLRSRSRNVHFKSSIISNSGFLPSRNGYSEEYL